MEKILIFDECVDGLNTLLKTETFNNLFFNYKLYKTSIYITCQHPLVLRPSYRSQIDYVFLLTVDNENNIKRLYEWFGSCFNSITNFKKMLSSTCRNWNYLIIHHKTNIDQKLYYGTIAQTNHHTTFISKDLCEDNDDPDINDALVKLDEIIKICEKLKYDINKFS